MVFSRQTNAQYFYVSDAKGVKGEASATINRPTGTAIDSRGYIWVANTNGDNISYWDGKKLNWYFGGFNNPGDAVGPGKNSRFWDPIGLAVYKDEGKEYLLIGDSRNGKVKRADITNMGITNYVKVLATGFTSIDAITADDEGNIYVVDSRDFTIKKIDKEKNVTVVAGESGVYGLKDGDALSARFAVPRGIYADGTDLYVSDVATIRKISDGKVSTVTPDPTETDTISSAHSLLKLDGYWYLADGCWVRRWKDGGSEMETIVGGECGYKTNAFGRNAQLTSLYGMVYSKKDSALYVVEQHSNRIRKIVERAEGPNNVEEPQEGPKGISLFPNPSSNSVNISGLTSTSQEMAKVSIFNLSGQTVLTQKLQGTTVDVSQLEAGMYILQVEQGGALSYQKLRVARQ